MPFEEKIVRLNSKYQEPVREWFQARAETDRLIAVIIEKLKAELAKKNIRAASPEVIFDYVSRGFEVAWSHKSAAFAAGLGTFGAYQMLITKIGCAGRFGTLLISAEIPPTLRPTEESCSYKRGEKCLTCVNRCPAVALSSDGLDKEKCFRKIREFFLDLIKLRVENVRPGPALLSPSEFYSFETVW